MCFKTNPGCACCRTLPLWAFDSFSTYNTGKRVSLNGHVESNDEIGSGLIDARINDADDSYRCVARSYDVVYRYGADGFGTPNQTIRQYDAKRLTQNWQSSVASTTFSATNWRHLSLGDFGLVLMASFADDSTPLALEIDKAGTWVLEPRSVTEIQVDGITRTSDEIVFSLNSKDLLIFGSLGSFTMVAGSYEFEVIDSTTCRLLITSVITATGAMGTEPHRLSRVARDRDNNLYLIAPARKVLPGLNTTSTTTLANLHAAPGPDFSWVWFDSGSKAINHGVRPRFGNGFEVTTGTGWSTIGGVSGYSTMNRLIRTRIAGAYICNALITPSDAAILFPDLDTTGIPLESGNINFDKYYINPEHTALRRRVPYNFGEIMAFYTDESSFPNMPTGQVLDLDSLSSDEHIDMAVAVNHAGDELSRNLIWELTGDAEFTLTFPGAMSDFSVADLNVYQFRFNWQQFTNWTPSTAVTAGALRWATANAGSFSTGDPIRSRTNRTTRPSFDSLEALQWDPVTDFTTGAEEPTITFDAIESGDLVMDSATQYTLTVPNVDGGKAGGALTITLHAPTDAYQTSNGMPLGRVPNPVEWYYVPPSSFVCDITRVDAEELAGSMARFNVHFYADPVGVTADDFVANETGTVTSGDISITGSGHDYTVTIEDVAGGVSGGTIGLDLDGSHNITSVQAPFTLAVDEDETYNVAAE